MLKRKLIKNTKCLLFSIFSKGLEELGQYFDGIYCTNSYQDYKPDNDGQDYIYPYLVKQLNVF